MGETTSVHDNERYGLIACHGGTTINVYLYQHCVLNDVSHEHKRQNIYELGGGTVQQKEARNK
jgi:hypothetical protein